MAVISKEPHGNHFKWVLGIKIPEDPSTTENWRFPCIFVFHDGHRTPFQL